MSDETAIPAERLMEAVDAVFYALDEMGWDDFDRLPSLLMGTELQPSVFCEFTLHEITEVERLLLRSGLLPCKRGPTESAC